MASKAAYEVTVTPEQYHKTLGSVTLAIGYELSPFRFSDYLSADQAMRLAAMLTHAAMQVREESEVVVEAEMEPLEAREAKAMAQPIRGLRPSDQPLQGR